MPLCWKYFCCKCVRDETDDEESESSYRRNRKRKRKRDYTPSGSGTWARQTLLDNEDTEYNLPYAHGLHELKIKRLEKHVQLEYPNSVTRLLDKATANKRPKVQDIFTDITERSQASRTTFPWMDESFTSRTKTNTHLGVSSIQINARRNEIARADDPIAYRRNENTQAHAVSQIKKSNTNANQNDSKFDRHPHTEHYEVYNGPARIQYTQYNDIARTHTTDTGYTRRNAKSGETSRPVSPVDSSPERRLVLTAPKTNVCVRRVNSGASRYAREHRIPKLNELQDSPATPHTDAQHTGNTYIPSSGVRQQTERAANRNPLELGIYRHDSNVSNYSYAASNVSNINYNANRNTAQMMANRNNSNASEFSLKRRPEPGIYSRNPQRHHSVKSMGHEQKQTKSPHRVESMYEYTPKAVQEVYASNVLEGNRIDDFFMQCLEQSELDKFGIVNKYPKPNEFPTNVMAAETSFSVHAPKRFDSNFEMNGHILPETNNSTYQTRNSKEKQGDLINASQMSTGDRRAPWAAGRYDSAAGEIHQDDHYQFNRPRGRYQARSVGEANDIARAITHDLNKLKIPSQNEAPTPAANSNSYRTNEIVSKQNVPNSAANMSPATGGGYVPNSAANMSPATGGGHVPNSAANISPATGGGYIPNSVANIRPATGGGHVPNAGYTGYGPQQRTGRVQTSPADKHTDDVQIKYRAHAADAQNRQLTFSPNTDMQSKAISVLSKRSEDSTAASFLESTEVFY